MSVENKEHFQQDRRDRVIETSVRSKQMGLVFHLSNLMCQTRRKSLALDQPMAASRVPKVSNEKSHLQETIENLEYLNSQSAGLHSVSDQQQLTQRLSDSGT